MPKPGKREIKDVWIEYKKTRSEEMRNILMENFLPLVRYSNSLGAWTPEAQTPSRRQ